MASCKTDPYIWHELQVKASAYNSVKWQTDSHSPNITAWGDTLKPGMKCVAVSRDLLRKGFKHNTPIKIEGYEGVYVVNDKMNPRYRNKIDIYMGVDVKKARQFGNKKLRIWYGVHKDSLKSKPK